MERMLSQSAHWQDQHQHNNQRNRDYRQHAKSGLPRCAGWLILLAHDFSTPALLRTCATNSSSFSDSRLISTLARAPSIAALANAAAVTRSDLIFGLVIGRKLSAI